MAFTGYRILDAIIVVLLLLTTACGQQNAKPGSDKKLSSQHYNDAFRIKEMSVVDSGSRKGLSSNTPIVVNGDPGNYLTVKTIPITAEFGTTYNESVSINTQYMFIYKYQEKSNKTVAVRVHVSCKDANKTHPVMFSARQQEGILSWSVPLSLEDSHSYNSVSGTLCPVNKLSKQEMDKAQYIFVEMTSSRLTSVMFHLNASLVPDFQISHNSERSVTVVTGQPKYYLYMFPDGVDQVFLRVTSKTRMCMTVSVQNVKCPVYDLENNIEFEGKHQTMSTQAALYLQRTDFEDIKGFYLVLLVRSDDERCQETMEWYSIVPAGMVKERSKTVEINIKTATSNQQYIVATMAAVGILLGFYVLAFFMGFIYTSCSTYRALNDVTSEEGGYLLPEETQPITSYTNPNRHMVSGDGEQSYFNAQPHRGEYGATNDDAGRPPKELDSVIPSSNQPSSSSSTADTSSINEEDIDFLPDVDQEKDVIRNKAAMFVSDLSRKKRSKLNKYYNQYIWNLISLAIFYALPVVQLVITYQKMLMQSGNEDLCYYNFDCSNPLKSYLVSFNNVFSNIGYVMLGFLFIFIVRSRHIVYSRAARRQPQLANKLGVPQHFGSFYAMGLALVMEGVMSGCYHVCPNYSNFQFDTSFMYIIACLCMLRIYQNRHTDVSAKSHTAYFSMAFVILIAVIGVVYGTNIFWIFYALIHMFSTFILSAQVYFLGRWNIRWHSFKRFILFLVNDCRRCSKPVSPSRFIMLVIGNIINWSFALYGAFTQPSDFASYLLAIFIGNLLLYCAFYVAMKLLSKERISWLVMVVMFVSVALWGCSLYFFFQHMTSWQKTPSGSREGNRPCILFDFYDTHDVWHFLSAFSLFFSFMILLLLDDDIALRPRNQIPVF